jgi:hypothetical protein
MAAADHVRAGYPRVQPSPGLTLTSTSRHPARTEAIQRSAHEHLVDAALALNESGQRFSVCLVLHRVPQHARPLGSRPLAYFTRIRCGAEGNDTCCTYLIDPIWLCSASVAVLLDPVTQPLSITRACTPALALPNVGGSTTWTVANRPGVKVAQRRSAATLQRIKSDADPPCRPDRRSDVGRAIVGGLHHQYIRA